jgi:hypothetical protein
MSQKRQKVKENYRLKLNNLNSKIMVAKKTKLKGKKRISAKKLCSSVIARDGVKKDGTLKKGYRYVKGGRVVKAKAKK